MTITGNDNESETISKSLGSAMTNGIRTDPIHQPVTFASTIMDTALDRSAGQNHVSPRNAGLGSMTPAPKPITAADATASGYDSTALAAYMSATALAFEETDTACAIPGSR